MNNVGILGLDTSHADEFASILDDRDDTDLGAVWDGGTVRNGDYAREFSETYDATLVETPEAMLDAVDGVMVLTVDWDAHYELARPFLADGIPTLVDKPIAGRMRDVEAMAACAPETLLFGGSAVPYHPAIETLAVTETPSTLYCVGYDDPFYYGGHLVDVVRRVVDANWVSVEPSAQPGLSFDVVFENDTFATIRLDGSDTDFIFLSVGDETNAINIGSSDAERRQMYESYVDAYLSTIAGSNGEGERVIDGAKLLVAIHASQSERRPVTPDSPILDEFHVSDDAFVAEYAPYY